MEDIAIIIILFTVPAVFFTILEIILGLFASTISAAVPILFFLIMPIGEIMAKWGRNLKVATITIDSEHVSFATGYQPTRCLGIATESPSMTSCVDLPFRDVHDVTISTELFATSRWLATGKVVVFDMTAISHLIRTWQLPFHWFAIRRFLSAVTTICKTRHINVRIVRKISWVGWNRSRFMPDHEVLTKSSSRDPEPSR